jgi:hypothetical protein
MSANAILAPLPIEKTGLVAKIQAFPQLEVGGIPVSGSITLSGEQFYTSTTDTPSYLTVAAAARLMNLPVTILAYDQCISTISF